MTSLSPFTPEELTEWESRYRNGGMGYGEAKKRLAELVIEYFKPYRDKRAALDNDIEGVKAMLKKGAERAAAVALQTLAEARHAVGLRS